VPHPKSQQQLCTCNRRSTRAVDDEADRTDLSGVNAATDYPHHLRRIVYRDKETNKRLVFLTNNFSLPPKAIADLYKSRWRIELFFKWIKQHLRIKALFGTSRSAVCTQIWIAISVFVLIATVKKRLALTHSLYTILQILSVSTFDKTHILSLFSDVDDSPTTADDPNQLKLFGY